MASPVSPGDVLALAQGVYKLYKKFRDAPEEMKDLGEQVKHVQIMLRFFKTQASQLEFLTSPDGKELSDDLERHLRKLRRLLRKVKDIGKQWRKAKKNFLRKLPFIFYTMRAVPDLKRGIIDRMFYINKDRELALQAGVNLGPGALNQIKTAIKEELARARAAEKSNKAVVDDAERKCRAATSALKRAASSRKPTSLTEMKTEAERELKQSGLPEADTQKLSVLFETELQNATNQAKLEEFRTATDKARKGGTSVKSSKSGQTNKSRANFPRIIVQSPPSPSEVGDRKKDNQTKQQKQDQKEKGERGKTDADQESRFVMPGSQQPKQKWLRKPKEENSNPHQEKNIKGTDEEPKVTGETLEAEKALQMLKQDGENSPQGKNIKKKHKKKNNGDKKLKPKHDPTDATKEDSKSPTRPAVAKSPNDPSKNGGNKLHKINSLDPKPKRKVSPKPKTNDDDEAGKADKK